MFDISLYAINSLFVNATEQGKLPRDKETDVDSFMTVDQLNRLAYFNLKNFIKSFTHDKSFK